MNNTLNSLTKYVIFLAVLGLLSACSNSGNSNTNTIDTATEMPGDLQILALSGGGVLRSFVTVDGNTNDRVELIIDSSGAGSASGSFPGLSLAIHSVLITYEYTGSFGTIILASASTNVDLTSGSESINFVAADYNLSSHDEDSDGVSNAEELVNTTDPFDDGCVIEFSVIGSCTLS